MLFLESLKLKQKAFLFHTRFVRVFFLSKINEMTKKRRCDKIKIKKKDLLETSPNVAD